MSNMGKNLQTLRGDIPRATVAQAINVSLPSYSAYERNDRIPRDEVKLRIAEYFGTTVQAIFFN